MVNAAVKTKIIVGVNNGHFKAEIKNDTFKKN